jgi:hypothetical protein
MPEPIVMELGIYVMSSEPISTAYVYIPSSEIPTLHALKLLRQNLNIAYAYINLHETW